MFIFKSANDKYFFRPHCTHSAFRRCSVVLMVPRKTNSQFPTRIGSLFLWVFYTRLWLSFGEFFWPVFARFHAKHMCHTWRAISFECFTSARGLRARRWILRSQCLFVCVAPLFSIAKLIGIGHFPHVLKYSIFARKQTSRLIGQMRRSFICYWRGVRLQNTFSRHLDFENIWMTMTEYHGSGGAPFFMISKFKVLMQEYQRVTNEFFRRENYPICQQLGSSFGLIDVRKPRRRIIAFGPSHGIAPEYANLFCRVIQWLPSQSKHAIYALQQDHAPDNA